MITEGEIANCYEARVSVYDLGSVMDLPIPSVPPYVDDHGKSYPIVLGDIVTLGNRYTWMGEFVAIVDAEMEIVAIVPQRLADTIVKLMNLAEPMINVIDRAEESSVADREATRGAARRECEEADERLRLAIAELRAVP